MNRQILRLALPNIVSNITVPVMGITGTAIAGRLGNSAEAIGALAIGVSIFNFVYWNCSFVRMGTSGLIDYEPIRLQYVKNFAFGKE